MDPILITTVLAAIYAFWPVEPPPPPPPPAPKVVAQSYVVLLPSPDGSVGKVFVRGQQGEQLLSQAQQGALLNGGTPPTIISDDQLQRDFGVSLKAQPSAPERFLLYFEPGGAKLTDASKILLPGIVEKALARQSVDISVVGHTDTQGSDASNERVARTRAEAIAKQLQDIGLKDATILVESHGKRNLLEQTPDETPNAKNRRVEITLR